jgi:glycerol-3-phosphate acyltransferase PlsY
MTETAFIVVAYLIGSISFAVVVSKFAGLPDPHTYGSGNPGATNVLRSGNKLAALITLLGDAAKGWLAVWLTLTLAPRYGLGMGVIAQVALAVFLGHLYPVFHRFHGGKGVATALGILLALSLPLGFSMLFVWLLVFYFSRVASLSSIVTATASPLLTVYLFGFGPIAASVLAMALLLVWRHRSNIRKLREGTEGHAGRGRA